MANSLSQTMPQNEVKKKYNGARNRFPMSYSVLTSAKYGDFFPFFVYDAIAGDQVPLYNSHKIRTDAMQSPFLASLTMHKDYFKIPLRAILPQSWENFITQPTEGSDIPDDAYCRLRILKHASAMFTLLNTFEANANFLTANNSNALQKAYLQRFIQVILVCEAVYSDASLFSRMRMSLSDAFQWNDSFDPTDNSVSNFPENIRSYDEWFEARFVPFLKGVGPCIRVLDADGNGKTYAISGTDILADFYVPIHRFLELLRYTDWKVESYAGFADAASRLWLIERMGEGTQSAFALAYRLHETSPAIDMSRVYAYQLVVHQFLINDKIDSVYTSKMYLQTMAALAVDAMRQNSIAETTAKANIYASMYEYNNVSLPYDFLSLHVQEQIWVNMEAFVSKTSDVDDNSSYQYIMSLLNVARSLRFGDYFTGARSNPYGIGDQKAPVENSGVYAVDVTRSLMMQRFLNQLARSGRSFLKYAKNVLNIPTPKESDVPVYLAHTSSTVTGFEVENTAENQGAITSMLKTKGGDYAFSIEEIDDYCVILGIGSFSVPRYYSHTVDRNAYRVDRFDFFNPYLQHIGDQAIYRGERTILGAVANEEALSTSGTNSAAFAYTLRDMQYKQSYPVACGAFVRFLKSWAMITDNTTSGYEENADLFIDSEYLRSSCVEFDRFFESLTNCSLAGYYHFILELENDCSPIRNMEFAPSIL